MGPATPLSLTSLPRDTAVPGAPERTALQSGTCVSHPSLRQPPGRARHALPRSHRRPQEQRPGRGPATRRGNLGAADAQRPAQILQLVDVPPAPSSLPVRPPVPGAAGAGVSGGLQDHLPGARAARCWATAAGAAGGAASGPARGCGRLCAARLIVPGCALAAQAAKRTAAPAAGLGRGGRPRAQPAPRRAAPRPRGPAPPCASQPLWLRHRLQPPRTGLGSPSGRAPSTGKLRSPLSTPPAGRPAAGRAGGCTAGLPGSAQSPPPAERSQARAARLPKSMPLPSLCLHQPRFPQRLPARAPPGTAPGTQRALGSLEAAGI